MIFSERVAACRERRGLSREALAELMNTTVEEITAWESGESEPALETLELLSQALSVSTDELLTGDSTVVLPESISPKSDVRIFMVIATACNILGFLLAVLLRSSIAVGFGVSLLTVGIATYVIGMLVSLKKNKQWVRRFWVLNIWFVAYWPPIITGSLLDCFHDGLIIFRIGMVP